MRTVALCLVGLSPAVVPETLYALARLRPRVVPDELHIVTTRPGAERVMATLLGPRGALAALRAAYRVPSGSWRCSPEHIHVLVDARNEPLEDIITTVDSRAVGDQLAALVRRVGLAPGTMLIGSVAGGRKTMGALLAMAMQLHGGAQDRLYHVLVAPPWERVSDFFFPTPGPHWLRGPDGPVDAQRAKVTLAEIPMVRLGPVVRRLGLSGLDLQRLSAEVEAEAQGRLELEPLVLAPAGRRVLIGEVLIRLPAQQFALYQLYALARAGCRRTACRDGARCLRCQLSDDAVHDRRAALRALYDTLRPAGVSSDSRRATGPESDRLEDFRLWLEQTRSRLNRRLRDALGGPGPRTAAYCVVEATGLGAKRCRGLGIQPPLIRMSPVRRARHQA